MRDLLAAIQTRDPAGVVAAMTTETPRITYYCPTTSNSGTGSGSPRTAGPSRVRAPRGMGGRGLAVHTYELPYDKGPERRFRYLVTVILLAEEPHWWHLAHAIHHARGRR